MRHPTRRRRSGFTILEIVLVVALAVILAAITGPSLERLYGDIRLSAAADLVRARWADCRSHAMDEGQPYRFAIQPDTGKFRIAPDRGEYWADGLGNMDSVEDPNIQPLVLEEELPSNVTFGLSANSNGNGAGGDWTRIGTFLPDGTCRENISIVFRMDGQQPLMLRLRGLTGTVRLEVVQENQP